MNNSWGLTLCAMSGLVQHSGVAIMLRVDFLEAGMGRVVRIERRINAAKYTSEAHSLDNAVRQKPKQTQGVSGQGFQLH